MKAFLVLCLAVVRGAPQGGYLPPDKEYIPPPPTEPPNNYLPPVGGGASADRADSSAANSGFSGSAVPETDFSEFGAVNTVEEPAHSGNDCFGREWEPDCQGTGILPGEPGQPGTPGEPGTPGSGGTPGTGGFGGTGGTGGTAGSGGTGGQAGDPDGTAGTGGTGGTAGVGGDSGVPDGGNGVSGGEKISSGVPDFEDFEFGYSVQDEESGQDFAVTETSRAGAYRVLLPDGRTQIVTWTVDDGGYRAKITYKQPGEE